MHPALTRKVNRARRGHRCDWILSLMPDAVQNSLSSVCVCKAGYRGRHKVKTQTLLRMQDFLKGKVSFPTE